MLFTGSATNNTIKIKGTTKKKSLNILIDSGSTHSFIEPDSLRQVVRVAELTNPLIIAVADGNKMASNAICKDFQWHMQGQDFTANLRVLPLGGCDVLGVDWLHNPITLDYGKLSIILHKGKKKVTLQGNTEEGSLKMISGKALHKLFTKAKDGVMGYIFFLTAKEGEVLPVPAVQAIIKKHQKMFEEPKGLPPIRTQDHKIPLKDGSQPVNLRPYRIPYIQKAEVEKQVREMLNSGIIQPSSSPFAAPVILVHKKDGT